MNEVFIKKINELGQYNNKLTTLADDLEVEMFCSIIRTYNKNTRNPFSSVTRRRIEEPPRKSRSHLYVHMNVAINNTVVMFH